MTETGTEKDQDYRKALSQVEEREQLLKTKWHGNGKLAWEIYLGEDEQTPFNILYSNTETIVPAVFSRKPIPRVLRRHDEQRADVPAELVKRFLSFCMDTNLPGYPAFMTTVEDAIMDASLPGQGLFRVRLVDGLPVLDYVPWNMFVWGFARRWEDVQWIAFAHDMTLEAVFKAFPDLTDDQKRGMEAKVGQTDETAKDPEMGEKAPNSVRVWERWDKRTMTREFLCDAIENCCLLSEADPLKLDGFFPIPPRPLNYLRSTTDLMPRALYRLYQEQAEELNTVTRRLKKVVEAIKVRGVYAGQLPEIASLFSENEDNTLIPTEAQSTIMTMNKGLDAYIWLIPIDKLIVVAKELYMARDAIKQTIYEILGIGDILRGVSKASETLGAQQIKDKWGSVRINRMREKTAEFIRDGLRLLAEVGIKHTPPEAWEKITGLKLKSQMEVMVLQKEGQPVPPMSTWEEVLGMLQDDLTRAYLIDIETNSSVDPAATEEKAEMAEFMNAFGQTMGGLRDVMTSSPQGWELGKVIIDGIVSKFDLGQEISPKLMALPPPPSVSGPPPEVQKMQQEAQKKMAEVQQREQAVLADEQTLRETQQATQQAADAIKAQQDQVKLDREGLRREEEAAKTRIESLTKESLAEIKMEKANLALEKANFAGEKAAVAAQAKANQQNKPKPAGGK